MRAVTRADVPLNRRQCSTRLRVGYAPLITGSTPHPADEPFLARYAESTQSRHRPRAASRRGTSSLWRAPLAAAASPRSVPPSPPPGASCCAHADVCARLLCPSCAGSHGGRRASRHRAHQQALPDPEPGQALLHVRWRPALLLALVAAPTLACCPWAFGSPCASQPPSPLDWRGGPVAFRGGVGLARRFGLGRSVVAVRGFAHHHAGATGAQHKTPPQGPVLTLPAPFSTGTTTRGISASMTTAKRSRSAPSSRGGR